jgi:phage baseplate assembly protein W
MLTNKLKEKVYADIDVDFIKHPITNDLIVSTNLEAVRSSIINLVMTKRGERLFQPEIGSKIHHLLFELPTPGVAILMEDLLLELIIKFEPRAVNSKINIKVINDSYAVTIIFNLKNIAANYVIDFELGTQT